MDIKDLTLKQLREERSDLLEELKKSLEQEAAAKEAAAKEAADKAVKESKEDEDDEPTAVGKEAVLEYAMEKGVMLSKGQVAVAARSTEGEMREFVDSIGVLQARRPNLRGGAGDKDDKKTREGLERILSGGARGRALAHIKDEDAAD